MQNHVLRTCQNATFEPAPEDKGHLYTNTDAIKQAYEIDQPALMKIKYVCRHTFRFSFLSHRLPRCRVERRWYGPADFHSEPIWTLRISKSMATGRQTLVWLSIKTPISLIFDPL